MNEPWPLLIGVLYMPNGLSMRQWRDRRVVLTARANEEGYALAEVFDVDGSARRDESVYSWVETLADRIEAAAVLISGPVDQQRIEEIAERTRMAVLELPPSTPSSRQGSPKTAGPA